MNNPETIGVAVVGLGYWGPNLVRNFYKSNGATVVMGCDLSEDLCSAIKADFPTIETTTNFSDVLQSDQVHLVAIATPVKTHYTLAKQALEAGKHVMLEKPMTQTVAEAEELIALAKEKNLIIAVDHPFVFSGAVEKMKELVDSGDMGKLMYYDSVRINLGLFRPDVNVVWDLLPHDLSILDYILGTQAEAVQAVGMDHFHRGSEDVAYVTVRYPGDILAHIHVSWTSPVKMRQLIIGGTQKMVVVDDILPDESMRVYDRGVDQEEQVKHETAFRPVYRSGDVWVPKLPGGEPLLKECQQIVDAIHGEDQLRADGRAGLRTMKILAAADDSLAQNSQWISIS